MPYVPQFMVQLSIVPVSGVKMVAGPKARALEAISRGLAEQGDIEGALRAETSLDEEPRDVVQQTRDNVLFSIAKAQARSGDLRGAVSTSAHIANARLRFRALLPLAGTSP